MDPSLIATVDIPEKAIRSTHGTAAFQLLAESSSLRKMISGLWLMDCMHIETITVAQDHILILVRLKQGIVRYRTRRGSGE